MFAYEIDMDNLTKRMVEVEVEVEVDMDNLTKRMVEELLVATVCTQAGIIGHCEP